MKNVEFKAELRDLEAARAQCKALDARFVERLQQVDTYFRLPDGRLKKRAVEGRPHEWIFYHRRDRVPPTLSNFSILTDQEAQRRWGAATLRQWLVVIKEREVWLHRNVRIHLDEVEQLGRFIEFEAVVSPDHEVSECDRLVNALRTQFEPILGEPVAVGYSDLIAQLQAESSGESTR